MSSRKGVSVRVQKPLSCGGQETTYRTENKYYRSKDQELNSQKNQNEDDSVVESA